MYMHTIANIRLPYTQFTTIHTPPKPELLTLCPCTYALSKLWDRVCLRRVALISFSSSPCVFVLQAVIVPRILLGGGLGVAALLLLLRVTRPPVPPTRHLITSSGPGDGTATGAAANTTNSSSAPAEELLLLSLSHSALVLLLAESTAVRSFKLMLFTCKDISC